MIVFSGPLPLGALAAAEQVRTPTMSRLVDGLERDGWVVRRARPGDRRVVEVAATTRGERLLQRARGWCVAALEAVLARLEPAGQREVEAAVARLEALLRDHRPGTGRPAGWASARRRVAG